jgi:Transposase DDE domain
MDKCTQLLPFVQDLFDDRATAQKATRIVEGILKARSPRLSEIARSMKGNEAGNYKCIQRFLEANDPRQVLARLFREQAPFLIGDPTEMPRPRAKRTEYVGTLSDAETSGYWLLLLATPYHGRAIPCGFVSYSSQTIQKEATSRNGQHLAAFAQVKELVGDRPLVLDREFSYLELLENLNMEGVRFVIRLKTKVKFYDWAGNPVALSVSQGKTCLLQRVLYKGKVQVNLIGIWKEGCSTPLWIMTNLNAMVGLTYYLERMKIEEAFRDLKSLFNFGKLMNKRRSLMEKMVALLLIAYTLALILGEALRSELFPKECRKHKLYSGPFIFLKLKPELSPPILALSHSDFSKMVCPVRTRV